MALHASGVPNLQVIDADSCSILMSAYERGGWGGVQAATTGAPGTKGHALRNVPRIAVPSAEGCPASAPMTIGYRVRFHVGDDGDARIEYLMVRVARPAAGAAHHPCARHRPPGMACMVAIAAFH